MCRVIRGLCATALGIACALVGTQYAGAQSQHDAVAHNYAVARNVAQEAVLSAASHAKALAPGDVWLEGATQCLMPVETSVCPISFDAAGLVSFYPAHWQPFKDAVGLPRWKILMHNKINFVFGAVDNKEMAAIRAVTRHSLGTSLCRRSTGATVLCIPPLLQKRSDGSTEELTLPAEIQSTVLSQGTGGVVVSVTQVVP